jgi:hypothetical protein
MDQFFAVAGHISCVHLDQLPPLTTLLVWTQNSLYRVVVIADSNVCVQGGVFFPEPTPAELTGASMRRGFVLDGCICTGLNIELCASGTRFTTSRVLAITTECARDWIVH